MTGLERLTAVALVAATVAVVSTTLAGGAPQEPAPPPVLNCPK